MINNSDRLESIEKEYNSLTKKLSRPEVFLNMREFQELSRKQKELEKIKNKYDSLKEINKRLEENLEIIKNRQDSELTALAEEENKQLSQQKKILEKELEQMLKRDNSENEKNIFSYNNCNTCK